MALMPKILIPTDGETHSAGDLLFAGFTNIGYPAELISYDEFYKSYKNDVRQFYLCVEDGRDERSIPNLYRLNPYDSKSNLALWFTNTNAPIKDRLDLCRQMRSCQIFFSDFDDFFAVMMNRVVCSWMPLAADSILCGKRDAVFVDTDIVAPEHDLDLEEALCADEKLIVARPHIYFGQMWYDVMIDSFRRSSVGVTNRLSATLFEMLACGIPVLISEFAGSKRIFGDVSFIREYTSNNIKDTIESSLVDSEFLTSGSTAREWILQFATYEVRAEMILDTLVSRGRLPVEARNFIRGEGVRK